MVDAYPLQWPAGWKRITMNIYRERAKFQTSFAVARDELLHELRLMGAEKVVLSTNLPLRLDGKPLAGARTPPDPGAAVYWSKTKYRNGSLETKQFSLACDRWKKVEENVQALRLSIAAMRGLDRWGASGVMDRAFTGFEALPPPPAPPPPPSSEPWWSVLCVRSTASVEECRDARRRLARVFHPDNGTHPDAEMMARINAAVDRRESMRTGV